MVFYMMLVVFQVSEKPFQTGWFVESLCTCVLMISYCWAVARQPRKVAS